MSYFKTIISLLNITTSYVFLEILAWGVVSRVTIGSVQNLVAYAMYVRICFIIRVNIGSSECVWEKDTHYKLQYREAITKAKSKTRGDRDTKGTVHQSNKTKVSIKFILVSLDS